MEQKLEPSEELANIRSADMLQSLPDEKSGSISSVPSSIDNNSGEGLQDKQDSVVTMSKVGLVTETDAEELVGPTKINSSSSLSNSCTRLSISGNGCDPEVSAIPDNGRVRGGVKVTRQGEGEDSIELPVNVSKIVQDEVLEDVQVPATMNLSRVETQTGDKELTRDAASKRKFDSEDENGKISSKLSKFYWSQDVVVQNVGITSSPSTGEPNHGTPSVILLKLCSGIYDSECFHLGI